MCVVVFVGFLGPVVAVPVITEVLVGVVAVTTVAGLCEAWSVKRDRAEHTKKWTDLVELLVSCTEVYEKIRHAGGHPTEDVRRSIALVRRRVSDYMEDNFDSSDGKEKKSDVLTVECV